MDCKRVCLVSDTIYDLNGVSRFIQDFSNEALKQNKEFYVIGSTNKKCEDIHPNIFNIKPLFTIKMPFYKSLDLVFPNFFKIYKKIKEIDPELLHISTPGFIGLTALLSSRILKIPVVGIYHTDFSAYIYDNTNSKLFTFISKKFLQLFYKPFHAIFSRTNEYKDILINKYNFKNKNFLTLKPGINLNRFYNPEISNNYFKNDRFKFLYVGRISVEKNIDFLINIFKELNSKDIELNLVGDIEIENINFEELKKYNINFLGRKTGIELLNIYASSNTFIFPSTTDTLGQVVIEAMASKLPVIVTNVGGPKEFVNEKFGFILDINDKKQWLEKIIFLNNNSKLAKNMGKEAFIESNNFSISESFLDFWNKNCEIIYFYNSNRNVII